jgi:hypothetical protein
MCFWCDCTAWSASEWQILGISVSRQVIRTTAWRGKHRPEKIKVQVVSCNVLIAILFSSDSRCWLPLLIWVIQWLEESVQLSHILARADVHRFFKSLWSYLIFLGTKRVTWSKLRFEGPQILGATVQNLFVVATWLQGFVHPWTRARGGRPRIRGSVPDRGRVYLVHNFPTGSETHRTSWSLKFHIHFPIHCRGVVLN